MKKILIFIGILGVIAFAFIAYSGAFTTVVITEKEMGPYTMVLMKHTGSYYKTKVVFDEVDAVLKKSIDTKKLLAVGLYYDDPAKVKEDQLRSECGFIVEKGDLDKIGALKDGLIVKNVKRSLYAVGEFPLKTFFSYMIGPMKAYPQLNAYGKGKKFTGDYAMEIYDMKEKKIFYCMPMGD